MEGLTVVHQFHIVTGKSGKKRLMPGKAPTPIDVGPGNVPRLSRLMALAIHFQDVLERGEVKDMAEIARLGHITRARMTQIMNLQFLAPDIQETILNLPNTTKGRDPLKLKDVDRIAKTLSWEEQREWWANLNM